MILKNCLSCGRKLEGSQCSKEMCNFSFDQKTQTISCLGDDYHNGEYEINYPIKLEDVRDFYDNCDLTAENYLEFLKKEEIKKYIEEYTSNIFINEIEIINWIKKNKNFSNCSIKYAVNSIINEFIKRKKELNNYKNTKSEINFNKLEAEGYFDDFPTMMLNPNFNYQKNKIFVYFRKIKENLLEKIKTADVIVGCVAWLTDENILFQLSKKQICSIIINKEDFLRPESKNFRNYQKELRKKYDLIPFFRKYQLPLIKSLNLSEGEEPTKAIRCMGHKDKTSYNPRMHNKFLVFLSSKKNPNPKYWGEENIIKPYAIWTGSFNLTQTGTKSFENAVYIEDKEIAQQYYQEYAHIFSLSEPLDWTSEYVEPEYRFGT